MSQQVHHTREAAEVAVELLTSHARVVKNHGGVLL
jgi:hypothetical protein